MATAYEGPTRATFFDVVVAVQDATVSDGEAVAALGYLLSQQDRRSFQFDSDSQVAGWSACSFRSHSTPRS